MPTTRWRGWSCTSWARYATCARPRRRSSPTGTSTVPRDTATRTEPHDPRAAYTLRPRNGPRPAAAMQINALDLRKGHLVNHQGRICTVSDWSIMRNDRRQYVYVTLKDLLTGRVQELKEHGDTKFEFMESEKIDL